MKVILTEIDGKIVDISKNIIFVQGQYCYYHSLGNHKVVTTPIYDLSKLSVAQLKLISNTKLMQVEKPPVFTKEFLRTDVKPHLKVIVKKHGLGVIFATTCRPAGKFEFYGKIGLIELKFEDILETIVICGLIWQITMNL